MTFVHPLLLGGLVLVGLPVLIHLIMRQKPKRFPFPAFRFLLQKHRTNQTRLRLRHLLLLLLRMAVIAALCLALVRPALTGGARPFFSGDRPVSAVLLIDTSYSMEYTAGTKTRLDEAKRRAGELLDELSDGSRVAVLDSAEAGGEWTSLAVARDRVASLKLRHANAPLPRQIEQAYRLFAEQDRTQENPSEAPPNVLYVFSDRTRGCWDDGAARGMKQPEGISAVFVDVGTDDPADLAITEVRAEPATVRPGDAVQINVTVQATGGDYEAEITCSIDGKSPGEKLSRKIEAGRGQVIAFAYRAAAAAGDGKPQTDLAEGLHQAEVHIVNSDALPFDNVGFTTFRVLQRKPVLVLADDPAAAREWRSALELYAFRPTVRVAADPKALDDLDNYVAVCLFNVADPGALWSRLTDYVAGGKGLAVVLGGTKGGPNPAAYNGEAAGKLLPARLDRVQQVADEKAQFWAEFQGDAARLGRHPLLARFRRWKEAGDVAFFQAGGEPRVSKFWKVTPIEGQADVLTHYTDKDASPALLERAVGRGRVLMLTSGPDVDREWNNYLGLSVTFGFSLTNLVVEYLAGETAEPALNYVTGQTVPVLLPALPFLPTYTLTGPGVTGSDATLTRQKEQRELRVVNATTPGNFAVLAIEGRAAQRLAAFSMSPRPDEYQLDRVPVPQIEALLGEGSVLPVGRTASLRDRLQQRWAQPLELAPWLLIALLLFLAVEGLLANRFYRQPPPSEPAASARGEAPSLADAAGSELTQGSVR